jgi:hypothetical protein
MPTGVRPAWNRTLTRTFWLEAAEAGPGAMLVAVDWPVYQTKLYYAGVGVATQSSASGFRNVLGFQSP